MNTLACQCVPVLFRQKSELGSSVRVVRSLVPAPSSGGFFLNRHSPLCASGLFMGVGPCTGRVASQGDAFLQRIRTLPPELPLIANLPLKICCQLCSYQRTAS